MGDGAAEGDLPVRIRGETRDPATGIIASDELALLSRRPPRVRRGQASASIRAASSKSLAVRPPSEWVESETLTSPQEISRSGW